MPEQIGTPKTHCQSFAKAAFPQKAVLAHCHQKAKNRRIITILTPAACIRQADNRVNIRAEGIQRQQQRA